MKTYATNRDFSVDFHRRTLNLPKGTRVTRVTGPNGGWVVYDTQQMIALGADEHMAKTRFCWLPDDLIEETK